MKRVLIIKNDEFVKLKRSIAIKCVLKTIIYSFIAIIITVLLIDIIFNDVLSEFMTKLDKNLYKWCMVNKILLMAMMYIIIFIIIVKKVINVMITFFVAQNKNFPGKEEDFSSNEPGCFFSKAFPSKNRKAKPF